MAEVMRFFPHVTGRYSCRISLAAAIYCQMQAITSYDIKL